MWVYLSVVLLSTFLAYQIENAKSKQTRRLLFVALFLVLFLVAALRYDTGIDYWNYVSIFERYQMGMDLSYIEWGFMLLVGIISSLGLGPQWVFVIISFFTILFFIKAFYEQSESFTLSIFFYMVLGYYFYSFNSIRYYLAVAIAFYSLKYILQKKYLPFLVWILVASAFHKSVLVVLLFYPVARFVQTNTISKALMFLISTQVVGIFSYFAKGPLRSLAFYFYGGYEGSKFDDGGVSVLNILLCAGTIVLLLMYYGRAIKDWEETGMYFRLICMGLALYMYGSWIPETSRIGYYLIIVLPVALSKAIISEAKSRNRLLLTYSACVVLGGLFLYCLMKVYPDNGTGVGVALLPYQTVSLEWLFG